MSTKETVAHGDNFHLYREVFDDSFIYLQMRDVQFEVSYGCVTLPIPVHVWEYIRQFGAIDLCWTDKSDEEIRHYVEAEVDKRMQLYADAEESNKPLIELWGSLAFGSIDSSRSDQIENGMAYFLSIKEHQQQVREAINELNSRSRV